MDNQRGNFTGRLGFVLAAAGSAVGLGNIWRFPYLAAKYGGGIFLLVYLLLVLTFGFSLMVAEIAIGRKTGLSAIGAFRKLSKKYSFIGYLESIVPIIILPYYCVIGGWVVKYFTAFICGNGAIAAGEAYFGNFITQPLQPVIWFAAFLLLTAVVVFFGVEKGIEKVSKVMMPVLVLLSLVIAVYVMFLPGAGEGLKYYLLPDFSKLSVNTVLGALGQMFYSMSLAMGIMITYGSYMKKEVNLEKSVHQIEIFDTGIAFIAGLMVVPAVVAFSGSSEITAGPGLMFQVLPQVFNKIPGGGIVGALFFLLVLFAALTSSISLMEAVVSIFRDSFKISRVKASVLTIVISILLGIPSSLGNGVWGGFKIIGLNFLDFCDFITNSVIMPVVALLTCIFVGYIIKPKSLIEEAELAGGFKAKKMFTVVIKYVAPICILLILISSILSAFGKITI